MKNMFFKLLLFGFLAVSACKKDKDDNVVIFTPGEQVFGWAKGVKEGKAWEASGYWRYHTDDSTHVGIDFKTYSEFGELREDIGLNEIPLSLGTYTIKGSIYDLGDNFVGGSYGLLIDDGDVAGGIFFVDENEDNFITITEIDMLTNIIKGFFQLHFIDESKNFKLEIKDGEFELRLYQ